jgi:hypothetical protein
MEIISVYGACSRTRSIEDPPGIDVAEIGRDTPEYSIVGITLTIGGNKKAKKKNDPRYLLH